MTTMTELAAVACTEPLCPNLGSCGELATLLSFLVEERAAYHQDYIIISRTPTTTMTELAAVAGNDLLCSNVGAGGNPAILVSVLIEERSGHHQDHTMASRTPTTTMTELAAVAGKELLCSNVGACGDPAILWSVLVEERAVPHLDHIMA
jgi:hypothetical protein